MNVPILLLDCSKEIEEKLKKLNFNVQSGTIGYCNGKKNLPSQVYENTIFIYNPSKVIKITPKIHQIGWSPYSGPVNRVSRYIKKYDIIDETPEFPLSPLVNRLSMGASMLVFVNDICEDIDVLNDVYGWIPSMPKIFRTKDKIIFRNQGLDEKNIGFLKSIIFEEQVKIPVVNKLEVSTNGIFLFGNLNGERLGEYYKLNNGHLILLPQYKSNDETISIFLNRAISKIYKQKINTKISDEFISKKEEALNNEIEKQENLAITLNEKIELTKQKLVEENRKKIQIIKSDETAILIENYFDMALQDDDSALFYLYKVIEAIHNKFGSEKEAKIKLGCNAEFNIIGKVSNESYRDIRHAPKPGEKIKEPTDNEIKQCVEAARKIIVKYFHSFIK